MRISCNPDDQGFMPESMRHHLVTLNGKPMPHAITADEELGLIWVFSNEGIADVLSGLVKIETLH